jgi:hypothetical protein
MRISCIPTLCVVFVTSSVGQLPADDKEKTKQTVTEKLTEDDSATISAALEHFMEQKEIFAFGGREKKKAIVIHKESNGPSELYLSDSQLQADLSGEKWELPKDFFEKLRQRNKKAVPFSDLKFGKTVLVGDFDKVAPANLGPDGPKEYAEAKAFAQMWLPVYSKDGKTAVVRFMFGPTPHGASATYLLNKKDGTWKVVNFCFAHYL